MPVGDCKTLCGKIMGSSQYRATEIEAPGRECRCRGSLWAAYEDLGHSPGDRGVGGLQPAHDNAVGLPL